MTDTENVKIENVETENIDEEESICQICCTNKSFYVCPDCNAKSCKKCLRKYILEYSNLEPHCIQCTTRLSFNVIYKILGRKYFDTYINKSARLNFELEVQKIPECLDCCTIMKFVKYVHGVMSEKNVNIIDLLIKNIKVNRIHASEPAFTGAPNDLFKIYLDLLEFILNSCSNKEISINQLDSYIKLFGKCVFTKIQLFQLLNRISEFLKTKYNVDLNAFVHAELYISLKYQIEDSIPHTYYLNTRYGKNKNVHKPKFVYMFRCSYDNCNGFVNNKFICELCGSKYCKKCFMILDQNSGNHECKEDDLLSAEEIMKTTKPCPKCASRIFKISGCSQMFCTNCHIGFDYNTGEIIKSNFHNPHRAEWLLSVGQNIIDNNLENDCDVENVSHSYFYDKNVMFRLYQMNHIKETLRKNERKLEKNNDKIFCMRCKYVLNKVSENDFIKLLKRIEVEKYKVSMLSQIYQEYIDVASLIFVTILQKERKIIQMLQNNNISTELYSYVVSNGFVNAIKQLVENDMTRNDYKTAIDKLLAYKKDNRERIYVPYGSDSYQMLTLIYEHRDTIVQFDSFDEELKLLNELIDHTNDMLVNYKMMFRLGNMSILSPLGSPGYTMSVYCSSKRELLVKNRETVT